LAVGGEDVKDGAWGRKENLMLNRTANVVADVTMLLNDNISMEAITNTKNIYQIAASCSNVGAHRLNRLNRG
jgi:hypothetical protein